MLSKVAMEGKKSKRCVPSDTHSLHLLTSLNLQDIFRALKTKACYNVLQYDLRLGIAGLLWSGVQPVSSQPVEILRDEFSLYTNESTAPKDGFQSLSSMLAFESVRAAVPRLHFHD
jgi:hypothetical protein